MVLTRQFRFPVFTMATTDISLRRPPGCWITPRRRRIVAEAEEESGFRVTRVEPVFTVFMSPGSVTEKLYFLSPNIRPMTVGATAADWRRKVRILKYWVAADAGAAGYSRWRDHGC